MTLEKMKYKHGIGWPIYDLWLRSAKEILARHDERGTTTPRHRFDVYTLSVCTAKSKEELEAALLALKTMIKQWRNQLDEKEI